MTVPNQYKWLLQEPGPKMLLEALKLYGTHEHVGVGDNPVIIAWAKELNLMDYRHDDIPWCGLFMALIAQRAGKEIPKNPLWALNWAKWGAQVKEPMLGDVLTFTRNGGGHVTMYVGEDDTCYHCLGGNQSDEVDITRILKSRLHSASRPVYENGQPANIRKVMLSPLGGISSNEA
jgi:uncharacterized protein (TIGR02594 family)